MNGRQRGIALISVLLVMSLALLITSGMLRSHRLSLQSSGKSMHHIHLRQLASAGETWALLQLQDAANASPKNVDLTQDWARTTPDFDIEGAQLRVDIEDLAGRFNLNSLLIQGQIDQVTLDRWGRLLELLDLAPLPLSQVGALQELNQLRLLPGVDGPLLRQLEPWVAVLPADAALNINTAPALVLRALDGVEATTAEALVRQRSATAWASVQAFTQDPLLAGAGLSSHGLGTGSRWFRITVQVIQGQSRLLLATDVERDPDTHHFKILQRRLLPSSTHEMPR
ncbi:type II secretion system protein K (GspK) [Pseudomonas sp. SJZ080]|uniref:type II secretion system protein GspK n=1 Tax=Pseudomonas sp. SJZ080 TaxID=2572888 RepID=UPI00119913AF|nr:type II secretion system protein GspK [Pseudomonas sp. SJZ080]TWC60764.1 type II secretion system protein K (GspK) [Pseudomonas sp. SJZ080]